MRINKFKSRILTLVVVVAMVFCSVDCAEARSYVPFFDIELEKYEAIDDYCEYLKKVRINHGRGYEISLTNFNQRKYPDNYEYAHTMAKLLDVKADSSHMEVRYTKRKQAYGPFVYVTADKEGTYTLTWTANISYEDPGNLGKMIEKKVTCETTVYVYDYACIVWDEEDDDETIFELCSVFDGTDICLNGKVLPYKEGRYNFFLDSKVSSGRLTADCHIKGFKILKIKVYGQKINGGKRCSFKNVKKGKRVQLNKIDGEKRELRRIKTGIRIIYRDNYTGVVKSEMSSISIKIR